MQHVQKEEMSKEVGFSLEDIVLNTTLNKQAFAMLKVAIQLIESGKVNVESIKFDNGGIKVDFE